MHATLNDLAAFFTAEQFKRAEAARMSGIGDLGRHRGGGRRHHGHHRGGPIFMGPQYYDPYWISPSPYLVISEVEDDENDKEKKKKKKRLLGTAFRNAYGTSYP